MQSISEETKQKLLTAGYKVENSGGEYFWALTPDGYSITRGPILGENEAWKYCRLDYDSKLDK